MEDKQNKLIRDFGEPVIDIDFGLYEKYGSCSIPTDLLKEYLNNLSMAVAAEGNLDGKTKYRRNSFTMVNNHYKTLYPEYFDTYGLKKIEEIEHRIQTDEKDDLSTLIVNALSGKSAIDISVSRQDELDVEDAQLILDMAKEKNEVDLQELKRDTIRKQNESIYGTGGTQNG